MKTTVNGIPTIKFSERIKQLLVKGMATIAVVKLLGRNLAHIAPFITEYSIYGNHHFRFSLWVLKTDTWLNFNTGRTTNKF